MGNSQRKSESVVASEGQCLFPDEIWMIVCNFLKVVEIFRLSRSSKVLLRIAPLSVQEIPSHWLWRRCQPYMIERCLYLTTLHLDVDSTLKDPDLKKFTLLKTLSLVDCDKITSDSLRMLTNLTDLDLHGNSSITDDGLIPLSSSLLFLSLSWTKSVTNKSLSLLTRLCSLDLSGNARITGASISLLTGLTELILLQNKVVSDLAIEGLTNLVSLNLMRNCAITGKSMSALTKLRELNLASNKTFIPMFLSTMTQLKILSLARNFRVNYEHVSSLNRLERLDVQRDSLLTTNNILLMTSLCYLNRDNNYRLMCNEEFYKIVPQLMIEGDDIEWVPEEEYTTENPMVGYVSAANSYIQSLIHSKSQQF